MDFLIWTGLFLILLYACGRGSRSQKNAKLDYSAIVAGLAVGLYLSFLRDTSKPYKR